MRTQMPIVIRFWANQTRAIPIDVCHGEIPDIFRTSMFEPTSEFELPDAKELDEQWDTGFERWLTVYRSSTRIDSSLGILDWSLTNGRIK